MLLTKRKPATVGEILIEEFMQPMGLTGSDALAARARADQACPPHQGRRIVIGPGAFHQPDAGNQRGIHPFVLGSASRRRSLPLGR